ncbi:hypothetical protein [Burkholderia anthina]|uniref:hypothetical protein n=1 Tax=Burkholderia anthina TaxID=179879 RepID=UPI001588B38C|nr:hypothetical protein [Burkholderia anthina]
MNTHSTDRLITGVLGGIVVTAAAVVMLRYFDLPSGRHASGITQTGVAVAIAACVLFAGPLLAKTVLRSRRDPLLLDEDLNASLKGRAVGLIGGVFIGITLCAQFL